MAWRITASRFWRMFDLVLDGIDVLALPGDSLASPSVFLLPCSLFWDAKRARIRGSTPQDALTLWIKGVRVVYSDCWPEHGSHARVSLSGHRSDHRATQISLSIWRTSVWRARLRRLSHATDFKAAGCLEVDGGGRGNGASTTAGCLGHVHGGGGTGFVASVLVDDGRLVEWRR